MTNFCTTRLIVLVSQFCFVLEHLVSFRMLTMRQDPSGTVGIMLATKTSPVIVSVGSSV